MKTNVVALLALALLTNEAAAIHIVSKENRIDEQSEQDLDNIMNKYDDREKPKPAPSEVHVSSSKPKVSASEV